LRLASCTRFLAEVAQAKRVGRVDHVPVDRFRDCDDRHILRLPPRRRRRIGDHGENFLDASLQ
jgi:hypothetical protein